MIRTLGCMLVILVSMVALNDMTNAMSIASTSALGHMAGCPRCQESEGVCRLGKSIHANSVHNQPKTFNAYYGNNIHTFANR